MEDKFSERIFGENKMRKTIKTICFITVAIVAALGVATARKANAQSNNNTGNPSILAAVEQVQSTVTGLQSSLATLQSSVAALVPPAASKVRFTPIDSAASGDLMSC